MVSGAERATRGGVGQEGRLQGVVWCGPSGKLSVEILDVDAVVVASALSVGFKAQLVIFIWSPITGNYG